MRHFNRVFASSVMSLLLIGCADILETEKNSSDAETPASQSDNYSSPITPEVWPLLPAREKDSAIEARIDALLLDMTIAQKVGQIIQADNTSITPQEVRDYRIGSVLSGGNSAPGGNPWATADQWVEAADAYYEASMDPEGVTTPIPVIWGIDAVHGHNNVIGGAVFPHNIGLGATHDAELIRRIASATAIELRVTGHDWTFAPTLAVPQDDRWGRTYEGFSEDPSLVAEYATAMVEGLQGELGSDEFLGPNKVIATAKHFIGDGGTNEGRDQGDALISEQELMNTHGAGYPPAITAGVQAVMASFSSWNGRKVHGDSSLLDGVLRDRFNFDGFVVGDWNAHGQIDGCTTENCPVTVNAGLDMVMAPDSWRGMYENTLQQAKDGVISEARLNEAVRRILRVKLRAGLFETGKPSTRPFAGDEDLLSSPEHKALAREAVRKSLVLLKNNNQTLPLDPMQRILVAGDGAQNIGKQSGGWTLTWQGGAPNNLFPKGQTIYDGIRETVEAAGGEARFSENGSFDDRPDAAIVVFGENAYAEFQGDISNLAYRARDSRDLEILKSLRAEGIPVVAVFLSGRPMWMNPHINAADAFVAAWLPGTEGGGVGDVLFAVDIDGEKADFTGRLSYSWPMRADQYDLNVVAGEGDALFPYGFGLSYGDDQNLDPLSEDPGIDISPSTNAEIFSSGRPRGVLEVYGGSSLSSVNALSLPRDSNEGVEATTTDLNAQEDSITITFREAGVFIVSGDTALDLRREDNAQMELSVSMQVLSEAQDPDASISIGMACLNAENACEGNVDISDLDTLSTTSVEEIRLSLSCFSAAGADMEFVDTPFVLNGAAGLSVLISEIRLREDSDGEENCA